MKPLNREGKGVQQLLQGGNEIRFTNFLHGTDHLKLRDLIHRIDVVDPCLLIPIALLHRIDTEKPWLSSGVRLATRANM